MPLEGGENAENDMEVDEQPIPDILVKVQEKRQKDADEAAELKREAKEIKKAAKLEKKHRGQAKKEAAALAAESEAPMGEAENKVVAAVAKDAPAPEENKAEVFSGDKFSDLPINDKLKQALDQNKFTELTEIQKIAIPTIIREKNVIMKSETGSGKTLAYLVPLIEKLAMHSLDVEKIRRDNGTYCIIFSPTRELCT